MAFPSPPLVLGWRCLNPNLDVRLLVIMPVPVEKLASEKSAKIKMRQEALQTIFFDDLDIFYPRISTIWGKGSFSTATPVINISNEVGLVKVVLISFFGQFAHTPTVAPNCFSLGAICCNFRVVSCPTYGLGSCHFIDSVLSTRHLSDHLRP
jgi:hypothetical protein